MPEPNDISCKSLRSFWSKSLGRNVKLQYMALSTEQLQQLLCHICLYTVNKIMMQRVTAHQVSLHSPYSEGANFFVGNGMTVVKNTFAICRVLCSIHCVLIKIRCVWLALYESVFKNLTYIYFPVYPRLKAFKSW